MGTSSSDEITPRWVVLPTVVIGDQQATAPTGSIAISGASLIVHNGTRWVTATTT